MKKQLSILQTFLVTCLLLVIGGGVVWLERILIRIQIKAIPHLLLVRIQQQQR